MATVREPASFRIDLDNLCLWRRNAIGADERLNLTPKTFDVLRYLVEHPRRLISHDELLEAVWPDIHVQPEVLKSHILAIRTALGDKTTSPRFIETQRGRGYRLIGDIGRFAAAAPRTRAPLELGAFAGRTEPLHEIRTLLQRAASGDRQAVFISGEPGIGKTTLVEQLLSHPQLHCDPLVARGHCIEGFAGTDPYYPVLEALRELCRGSDAPRVVRALIDLTPTWATQVPAPLSAAQRSELREARPNARSRMIHEGCNLFEALAAERPLVLVLEDLHWADFATIDLISALCRRRSPVKLMLIGTYRPEGLTAARHPLKQMTRDLALRKYVSEIELPALSTAAISELLAGGADGKSVPAEFTQFINDRTNGNPLFMRVTLEHLLRHGDVSRTTHGWQLNVPLNRLASDTPPTLARAIEEKIDGISDDQRRVLEAGSVAGLRFDPATTARAAGMDEQSFESICEELARNVCTIHRDELLALPNGQLTRVYAFDHAMYRQVLYDRIGESRRAQLHRTIAERLEEIYPPDQRTELAVRLAQHFASGWEWARALDHLRAALRIATIRYARRDALSILDRAAEVAANLPSDTRIATEIELLERRGAIQAATYDRKARETYSLLAEKAGHQGDINAQCRALIGLAYVTSWHNIPHSMTILNQILALADKLSDPFQRDVLRMSAYVRRIWGSGWNRDDARECDEAFARIKTHADSLTIARAQISFSMACVVSTRYRETLDLVHDSYHLLQESPQSLIEVDLARAVWMHHVGIPWALLSLGQLGASLGELNATVPGLRETDDLSTALSFQVYRGMVRFHALDFEGVLRDCEPVASHLFDQAADTQVLPVVRRIALIYSGLAEMGLGNNTVALKRFRAAEAEMEGEPAHLDWYWRLALEWGLAGLLISDGDGPEALARAKRCCDLAARTDERTWQALAYEAHARAALACGMTEQAIEHVIKALAACERVEVPIAEWRVHATAAKTYKAIGDARRAKLHTSRGTALAERLADSLPNEQRVQFQHRSASLLALTSTR